MSFDKSLYFSDDGLDKDCCDTCDYGYSDCSDCTSSTPCWSSSDDGYGSSPGWWNTSCISDYSPSWTDSDLSSSEDLNPLSQEIIDECVSLPPLVDSQAWMAMLPVKREVHDAYTFLTESVTSLDDRSTITAKQVVEPSEPQSPMEPITTVLTVSPPRAIKREPSSVSEVDLHSHKRAYQGSSRSSQAPAAATTTTIIVDPPIACVTIGDTTYKVKVPVPKDKILRLYTEMVYLPEYLAEVLEYKNHLHCVEADPNTGPDHCHNGRYCLDAHTKCKVAMIYSYFAKGSLKSPDPDITVMVDWVTNPEDAPDTDTPIELLQNAAVMKKSQENKDL